MFIFFNVFKGYCQKFYLTIDDGSLKSITITKNGLVSANVPGCTGSKYYSIATLNNKLYYLENGEQLSAGDLTGSPTKVSNCRVVATKSNNNAASANNLAIDNNGVAYYADGLQLCAIFPGSSALVHVGQLPYYSAGDLVFYKNELYMATDGGIVKVPLNDPSKSSFYIKIPNKTIFGLASAIVNGKNTIYAISVASKTSSQIIELDMSGKKVKAIIGTVPYYVLDAASEISDADIHIIETPNTFITRECNMFNKAHVEIVCKPHTGQYTFTLNTGEKNRTGIFDNISPGKYTLVITSTENVVSKTVNFTVKDFTIGNPVIAISKKNPSCATPGEIKLDAGAANSLYKIKFGNDVFDFDHTFTGLAAGPYHFTILNAQGCIIDEKDITLTRDNCPIVVSATNISQECDVFNKAHVEIVCSPHNSTYTFTLNTGQKNTTGIFDNLSPGSYQANITSNGFETPAVANFAVNDFTTSNPIITVVRKNPKCNSKGELKLDAGDANSLYKIKFGNDIFDFDHTFTGLAAGPYHFTILNGQGCVIDEKDYALAQDDCPIEVSATNISQQCDVFNKAHVEIICSPHNSTYTFTLNTGQKNTTGIFDNLSPGSYQANITSNGFETPAVANFTVNDFTTNNPIITVVKKNPVCNSKGELKLDAGTANSSYKIKYRNDIFGFDHTFTGLVTGTYHFTILNDKGCVADEKDYTLTQEACPPVGVLNAAITQECDVFNKAHVEIVCTPHANLYTFTLDNGQNNTTGIFDNLAPGKYQATVTSNGDESPVTINFTVDDFTIGNPVITFMPRNPVCDLKGEIKLDAGIANSLYTIRYGNNVFGFDHVFTNLVAGNYHFTILNTNGCVADEKDYVLQQDACPPITINNVDVKQRCDIFNQASIQVSTTEHPDTYTYALGGFSNTTGIFDALKPGTYNLVITSSGGDRKELQVVVPDFSLSANAITYVIKNAVCTLPGEIKFTANAGSNGASQIKHGAGLYTFSQTIKGLQPGPNSFTILNQQGCIIDVLDVDISQDDCNPVVFPNAFTPNGDGINDVFRPNQDSNPLNYKLFIYDRQGALIFQSLDFYKGWDGKYNGKPVPFGVYYWISNYTMPGAKTATLSGYVTLMR